MQLYDDQTAVVLEVLEKIAQGHKRILIWAPTGSGKTVIATALIRTFQYANPSFFLVNRQTLVSQTYETMDAFEIPAAVVHNTLRYTRSGKKMNTEIEGSKAIISLAKSYENLKDDLPEIDSPVLIIDEAHKGTSESFQNLRNQFTDPIIIGLSATPGRIKNENGQALSDWYDVMVSALPFKELIKLKRVCQPVYYGPSEDAHIVETWKTHTENAENKRTIVFVSDTRHSKAVQSAFLKEGIPTEIITLGSKLEGVDVIKQTPLVRDAIYNRFRRGETLVLVSVQALCEGFDEPLANFCFICRNISHVSTYHQMCGRVLRRAEDKYFGHIVDFYKNINKFGPIEDYLWEFGPEGERGCIVCDDGDTVNMEQLRQKKIYVCCSSCSHVYNVIEKQICSHCRAYNSVKIQARVGTLVDLLEEQLVNSKINRGKEHTKERFLHFVDKIERAIENEKWWTKFNELFFEAFDQTGLKTEFNWLRSLISHKKELNNMRNKIEVMI